MTLLIVTSVISGSIALQASTASAVHSSGTVVVGPSSPSGYTTIQEGINHANDGDTVVVNEKTGSYSGPVRVNKSVNIVANGSVVIDGQGSAGSAFIVNNSSQSLSNVSIVGFTITNFARSSNDITTGNGVYVSEDDLTNVSVRKNTFTSLGGSGVSIDNPSGTVNRVSIRNNDFSSVSTSAVLISGEASSSVSDILVGNNTLSSSVGSATRVYLKGQSELTNITVAGNDATDVTTGLDIVALEDARVSDVNATLNRFTNTTTAISVNAGTASTANASVTNLDISKNALNKSETGVALASYGMSRIHDIALADGNNVSRTANGFAVATYNSSSVANVVVRKATFEQSSNRAVGLMAFDSSQVSNVTIADSALNKTKDGLVVAARDQATVSDITATESTFSNATRVGILFDAESNSSISDVSMTTIDATNTSTTGAISLTEDATLTDLTVRETIGSNSDMGFVLSAEQNSSAKDILLQDNAFNDTAGTGVYLSTNNSASLDNVTVDTADLSGNADAAMGLEADGDSKVTNVTVTTVLAESSGSGLAVMARDNAVVKHLSLFENGFNNTAGTGVHLFANKTATLDDVSIDTADASDNAGSGLALTAGENATVTEVNVTTVLTKGSDAGFVLTAQGDAVVEGVTLFENAFNDTQVDGIALTAKESATLKDVMIDTAEASSTQVGLDVTAMDTAQIQNLTAKNLQAKQTGAHGVRILATSQSTTETPNITDVTLRRMLINGSAGAAIQLETAGGGELSDVTLREALLNGNADGIGIVATDESMIGPVYVRQALIENQTNAGINIDVASTASHQRISVRETLLANNSNAGLRVSSSTVGADIELHRSLINGNGAGVVNLNDSGIVDARFNYWGDSTGPSSEAGASSSLQDPIYGNSLANGAGDSVSEGATAGVANVRFAPAIGGKTQSGDQLIDPVPDQQLSITIADQTIEGPLTDFVGLTVWERSILPLRADSDAAATSVLAPELFLRTNQADINLNRQNLSVFTKGTSVPLSFEKVSGADTTRYANDDAQLIILRVNSEFNSTADLFDTKVTDNGTVTVETEGAEVVDVRDRQLDGTGELSTSFTPQQAGDYVAVLSTTNIGDGFEQTSAGGLSINAVNESVTLIGAEHIAVQTAASTVTPNRTKVNPGEQVAFDAAAEFTASDVNHIVVAYDKQKFTDKTLIVDTTKVLNQTDSGMLVRINGTVDSEPFFIEATVEDGSVSGFETGGSLEGVNQSVAVVRSGAATETLTLPIAKNLSLNEDDTRTFRYVHVAVSGDGQKRSTNAGLLTVAGEAQPDPPANLVPQVALNRSAVDFNNLRVGRSRTKAVTIRNKGNGTLKLKSLQLGGKNPGQFTIVSGGASGTLQPGETQTVRVRFNPKSAGDKQAKLQVRTNDSERQLVRVALNGTARTGGGGGGQGGGGGAGSADPVSTNNGATVNFRGLRGGQPISVTLPNVASENTAVTGMGITTKFNEGSFRVEFTKPQSNPTEGAPALDPSQGTAVEYFSATAIGISDDRIDEVTFTFTISPSAMPDDQSPDNVRLFRYVDGEWTTLETTHLGGNEFRAKSPGFTAYAIGFAAPQDSTETATPSETDTPTQTDEPTTDTDTPSTGTDTPDDEGGPFSGTSMIIVVLVLLLALAAGAYFLYTSQ